MPDKTKTINGLSSFKKHLINFDILPENPTILDMGASDGDFAHMLLEKIPKAIIHCFEPNRSSVARFKHGDRITLMDKAVVGGRSGKADFYEFAGRYHEWSNITKLYLDPKEENYSYEVETININKVLDAFDRVDYLKMDVEGCEGDIIKAIKDWDKIKQISVEIHDNVNASEMFMILEGEGFTIDDSLMDTHYNCGELYGVKA